MRYIRKGEEPKGLLKHRLSVSPGSSTGYEDLPAGIKDEIREQLVREQGFLCCYCMRRIHASPERMKIEHWAPQSESRQRQLDWKNLMGACRGGEGSPRRDQHCDTHKGDTPLTVNPMEERCERLMRFLPDGTVASDDPATQVDLERTLNLNQAVLKSNRKAVLDAFQRAMVHKYSGGKTWSEGDMKRELERLRKPNGKGELQEYCEVPIYWLKKRIGRAHFQAAPGADRA